MRFNRIEEAHVRPDLIEVSQVLAHALGQVEQALNHCGVIFSQVCGLPDVFFQVDQERFIEAHAICRSDVSVDEEGFGAGLFHFSRQMQFPFPLPHGLEMHAQVIVKRFVRIRLVEFAVEEMSDVLPVDDTILWDLGSRQGRQGRQHVECASDLVAGGSGGNATWSPQDGRHTYPALEGGYFSTPKRIG
jgi:hypothetical protein